MKQPEDKSLESAGTIDFFEALSKSDSIGTVSGFRFMRDTESSQAEPDKAGEGNG